MYEAEKIAGAELLVRLVNEAGAPPDLIVQAGVGYGHVEVPVLRAAWPNAEWLGFEPNPMIPTDGYPGPIIRAAVSRSQGFGPLFVPPVANRGSLLQQDDTTRFGVPVLRLDAVMANSPPARCLLWLDCEGSELAALEGAGKWLERVIAINVELWDKSPAKGWPDGKTIDAWLVSHGFHCTGRQRLWPEYGIQDAIYLRDTP